MLPLLTIIVVMCAALMLGTRRWTRRGTRVLLIAILAIAQTFLVLFAMFTMKPPGG